jgi:hypothetical protein
MPLQIEGGPGIDLRSFEAERSNIAHMYAAAVDAQTRQNIAGMQANQHAAELGFRQQQWQDEPGRDAARQQRASALEQQAYAGRLSMHEQMDMQKQQNQIGYIRDAIRTGALTEDQARDAILHLQTGVNAYQARQQASEDQDRATLRQQQIEMHRHQMSMQQAQARLEAQGADERTSHVRDRGMLEEERQRAIGRLTPEQRAAHDDWHDINGEYHREQVEHQANGAVDRRGGTTSWFQTSPGHYTQINNRHYDDISRLRSSWEAQATQRYRIPQTALDDLDSANETTRARGQAVVDRYERMQRNYINRQHNSYVGFNERAMEPDPGQDRNQNQGQNSAPTPTPQTIAQESRNTNLAGSLPNPNQREPNEFWNMHRFQSGANRIGGWLQGFAGFAGGS